MRTGLMNLDDWTAVYGVWSFSDYPSNHSLYHGFKELNIYYNSFKKGINVQSAKILLLPPKYEIIVVPTNHSFF